MDQRFLQDRGTQAYTGTELILKGALEGGVSLLTGYPGSPVADFFNSARHVKELLKEKGIVFQVANNEALGAARVNGAQMEDIKAIVAMKSVGAHVASDGLALGNLSKTSHKGGALVIIGDDPWSESTQVPGDSRFLAKHLHMPVMEPATFQELKDWVPIGLDLSAKSNLYVSYIVTTNLADGGGSVTVYPNQYPSINTKRPVEVDTEAIPVEETVVLSPRTAVREETLADRHAELIRYAQLHEVNKIFNKKAKRKIGFITSGLAFSYLEHALYEMGLNGEFPILKFGITYPIDESIVKEFAETLDEIIIVEEKRDFIESQILTILSRLYQAGKLKKIPKIWGKEFPFSLQGIPETRGLNPSLLIDRLGTLFLKMIPGLDSSAVNRIEFELLLIRETSANTSALPQRTPTFCPGCPHRDSSNVLLEIKRNFKDSAYMRRHHNRESVDLLFHGDTGCYTMLMFEPNSELMHNYSGMGLGGGTGAGIDPFITNKQAVFMGDSTFFHSGMIAISDAIKHGQDITFIILDNGTTAMTGHQPTAAQEFDLVGNPTVAQNIERVVEGMAKGTGIPIHRVNPAYRESYRELLEETLLKEGVKIIIADKECGITYDRKVTREENKILKEKGFIPEKRLVNVVPEVCEFCLECTKATGCPGLTIKETHYGPKLITDLSWCKSDGACTKIHACPSFEEILIKRSRPVPAYQEFLNVDLPKPNKEDFNETWNAYIAGVGGMGIGVVTAILVRAAIKQGYQVRFADKKGLAIRNGGVYSHVSFSKNGQTISPITPYGKTNLLIGIDILEAARSVDSKMNLRVANPRFTSALINTHKTPTVSVLLGKEDFKPSELEDNIRKMCRHDRFLSADASELAEQKFGNKVFANLIMLGMAYQKGFLPIDLENMKIAIEQTVPADAVKKNLSAFNLGRLYIANPKQFSTEALDTYESVLAEKTEILKTTRWRGLFLSRAYRNLVVRTVAALRLNDETNMHLALRIYDLIQFENTDYARTYVNLVKKVRNLDRTEFGFKATKAVVRYLFKVMAIKDEIYVAHLLTSAEKRKRDFERYQIDPKRGDRAIYKHINRPEFNILGFNLRFHMITSDWQLQIMKKLKFLRKLMPMWHAKEKAFRKWYMKIVQKFHYSNYATYETYVKVFELPEEVRGYREVRYPKMEEAKQKAEILLKNVSGQEPKESGILSI